MKSSHSTNGILGLKRSVDMNKISNLQPDEEKQSSESTKSRRSNKATKTDTTGDLKPGSEKNDSSLTFTSEDDVYYEPGDCVYVDSQRPDVPFFICSIKEFRMSKRDNLVVTVRWYYRPSEVPESVYQLLVQDRNTENGSSDHILEDDLVKERELFISDTTDVYPAAALRGKCKVRPFVELSENLKDYISKEDCFFYLLGYNPETRRLANTKGEIRVGPSHQAILPECQDYVPDENDSACETSREVLVWSPILEDYDLMMYLRASRSMAQYAGMCSGGTPEDGFRAMSQDATTSNALTLLHESSYDCAKALQALVKKPYPKELRKKWTDDDIKKFVKGLRQFGKNFYKIHKELLTHKKTCELVEYYYIWKKSHSALSSRPHRRRRHNILRRKAYTRSSRSISSEFVDLTSCSEDDDDSDESTERDLRLYCCRHCYTSESRSWHHGGHNKVILCTDCRVFFKKYSKLPPIEDDRKPPPHMFKTDFKELAEDEACWNNGKLLRSRRSMPVVQTTLRSGRNKMSSPVESLNTPRQSPVNGRRAAPRIGKPASPSDGSSSSTGSSMNKDKNRKTKSKKNKLKRSHDQSSECGSVTSKRKKPQESDEEPQEDASDTSSATGGRDSVVPDFDARSECSNTTNQDDNLSTRSNSPLVLPIIDTLPAKFKRVGPGDENRSCARTDVVFVHPEKPIVKETPKPTCTEPSAVNSTVTKPEVSESSSTTTRDQTHTVSRQSPKNTPATVTSHYESALRNMMVGNGEGYPVYPPNAPAILAPGVCIPGYAVPEGVIDYRMLQYMYPGGVVPESRENVAKFAEGFEQWYAPYRSMGQIQGGHYMPYQLLGRGIEQNALTARASQVQAHEAMMKNAAASGRSLVLDPVTGIPVPLGNHHSHSHMHTHFHIHPHEQQQMQVQAAAAAAAAANMDRAVYIQAHAAQVHPGLAAWRNQQIVYQHPELMQLHASGMVSPAEEHMHGGPIHGLGSTPLDRQLQQQLLLSQHSKYHQHSLQQQLMQQEESYMRHLRHHQDMQLKQRLEEASGSDPYGLFRKDHRNLQSPSQLDNVVKKNLESGSGTYVSPTKKPPVTIDLSDD